MRVVRIAITALAVLFAGLLVPGIEIAWSDEAGGILIMLVGIALIFGVVNAFVQPAGRIVSIPLKLVTFGMFSFVVNASLLLIVAAILDLIGQPILTIGSFPPDLNIEAATAAALGAVVISVVTTSMNVLIPDTGGIRP